jgi:hypothetical protein
MGLEAKGWCHCAPAPRSGGNQHAARPGEQQGEVKPPQQSTQCDPHPGTLRPRTPGCKLQDPAVQPWQLPSSEYNPEAPASQATITRSIQCSIMEGLVLQNHLACTAVLVLS